MVVEVILLVALIGAVIKFGHWAMGSPAGPEWSGGRIFSIWGKFVATQFAKYHNRETERINKRFIEWKKIRQNELAISLSNTDSETEKERLTAIYMEDITIMQDKKEDWRKLNPWKMAGACLPCWGTWFSYLLWIATWIGIGFNPIYILFGAIASVMVAVRLPFGE